MAGLPHLLGQGRLPTQAASPSPRDLKAADVDSEDGCNKTFTAFAATGLGGGPLPVQQESERDIEASGGKEFMASAVSQCSSKVTAYSSCSSASLWSVFGEQLRICSPSKFLPARASEGGDRWSGILINRLIKVLGADSDPVRTISDRTLSALHIQKSSLMRAVSGPLALHRFGHVFSSSSGNSDTYNMSIPAKIIDAFISHNWSNPRSGKFLALVFVFNFQAALILVCFAVVGILLLATFGRLPEYCSVYSNGRYEQAGVSSQVLGVLLFITGLLCWHEIQLLLGLIGKTVFLDKCCIYQTDQTLKREGIKSLAGFLCRSSRMVILYSDTYLQKLWTVYELASFLAMCPSSAIVVMPLSVPKGILSGMIMFALYKAMLFFKASHHVHIILAKYEFGDDLAYCTLLLAGCVLGTAFAVWARAWAREQNQIKTRIAEFRICNTKYNVEEDRVLVHGNIAAFMKDLGYVNRSCGEDEALSVFDQFVREEVPDALFASFGPSGVPYRYVVVIFLAGILDVADRLAGSIQKGTVEHPGLDMIDSILLHFAIYPVVCACGLRISRHFLWLNVRTDVCFSALVGVMCVMSAFSLTSAMEIMSSYALNSGLNLFAYCFFGVFFICLATIMYHCPSQQVARNSLRFSQGGVLASQPFTEPSQNDSGKACNIMSTPTQIVDVDIVTTMSTSSCISQVVKGSESPYHGEPELRQTSSGTIVL